jgi:hypothetical protein
MRLEARVDSRALTARTGGETRQLAFSTAETMNETAKAIQEEQRVNLDKKFYEP